jgi:Glutathione S-transferase
MPHVLIHLPISAWSRRARQALALEGIPHRRQVYVPTVGEPSLRWRTGRWRGPVHVPVLLPEGERAIMDSTEIAAWASGHGEANLLPDGLRPSVEEVVGLAEAALGAGRIRATRRVLDDPAALRESLPPALAWLGPSGVPIAASVARGLIRKYDAPVAADVERALADAIEALATRVGDGPYLLDGRLTWADLAAASALTFVRPAGDMALGDRTRAAFTHELLAERFADLLAWRAAIDAEAAAARGGR